MAEELFQQEQQGLFDSLPTDGPVKPTNQTVTPGPAIIPNQGMFSVVEQQVRQKPINEQKVLPKQQEKPPVALGDLSKAEQAFSDYATFDKAEKAKPVVAGTMATGMGGFTAQNVFATQQEADAYYSGVRKNKAQANILKNQTIKQFTDEGSSQKLSDYIFGSTEDIIKQGGNVAKFITKNSAGQDIIDPGLVRKEVDRVITAKGNNGGRYMREFFASKLTSDDNLDMILSVYKNRDKITKAIPTGVSKKEIDGFLTEKKAEMAPSLQKQVKIQDNLLSEKVDNIKKKYSAEMTDLGVDLNVYYTAAQNDVLNQNPEFNFATDPASQEEYKRRVDDVFNQRYAEYVMPKIKDVSDRMAAEVKIEVSNVNSAIKRIYKENNATLQKEYQAWIKARNKELSDKFNQTAGQIILDGVTQKRNEAKAYAENMLDMSTRADVLGTVALGKILGDTFTASAGGFKNKTALIMNALGFEADWIDEMRYSGKSTEVQFNMEKLPLEQNWMKPGYWAQSLAQSAPTMALGMVTTALTGNPYIGGIVSFMTESMENSGGVMERVLANTGDLDAASLAGGQTFIKNVPTVVSDILFQRMFSPLKVAKGTVKEKVRDLGVSMFAEGATEAWQTASEMSSGVDAKMGFGRAFVSRDARNAAIEGAVSAGALGGAGVTVTGAYKALFDKKNIPSIRTQAIANTILSNGETAAMAGVQLDALANDADDDALNDGMKEVTDVAKLISDAQQVGLTPQQTQVFVSMSRELADMKDSLSSITDPTARKIIENQIAAKEKEVEGIVSGQTPIATIELQPGLVFTGTVDGVRNVMNAPEVKVEVEAGNVNIITDDQAFNAEVEQIKAAAPARQRNIISDTGEVIGQVPTEAAPDAEAVPAVTVETPTTELFNQMTADEKASFADDVVNAVASFKSVTATNKQGRQLIEAAKEGVRQNPVGELDKAIARAEEALSKAKASDTGGPISGAAVEATQNQLDNLKQIKEKYATKISERAQQAVPQPSDIVQRTGTQEGQPQEGERARAEGKATQPSPDTRNRDFGRQAQEIERRRQEELNRYPELYKKANTKEELQKVVKDWLDADILSQKDSTPNVRGALMTPGGFERGKELFLEERKSDIDFVNKEINAKYDAELSALQAVPEVTPAVPAVEEQPQKQSISNTAPKIGRKRKVEAPTQQQENAVTEQVKTAVAQEPTPLSDDAKSHATSLGGVAFEVRPGLGIVQGFNMFGKPIYSGFKGGSRTKVDIDSYTGTGFTADELAELKALRQNIEATEAANQAQFGSPFDRQGRVAASDSVPDNVKGFVNELTANLGINNNIFIITDSDFTKEQFDKHGLYGTLAQVRSALLSSRNPLEYGAKRFMSDANAYYIYYDAKLTDAQRFTTISHEIGHIVEQSQFNNASAETKNKIKEDYQKWFANLSGKSLSDVINETRDITIQELFEGNTGNFNPSQHRYISSFSEYFADNVAKWARTSEKPRGLIDTFFANLKDLFTKILDYVTRTGNYSKNIFEWLDGLYGTNVSGVNPENEMLSQMAAMPSGRPPSVGKLLGTIQNVAKVTMTEKAALQKQIRDLARGARDAMSAWKEASQLLSEDIANLVSRGTITAKQQATIIKKFGKINMLSPKSVGKFVDYMTKIFADAEYQSKLDEARGLKKKISKLSKGKERFANLRDIAKKFLDLEPSVIEDIDGYNKVAAQIKESLTGTRKTKEGIELASIINVDEVGDYIKNASSFQMAKQREETAAEFQEFFGVDASEFNYDDMIELMSKEGDVPKRDEGIVRSAIKKAFGVYSTIIRKTIATGIDPFTEAPVEISEKNKNLLKRFMNMDLDSLDIKQAMQAVDALNNFITNKSTAKMDAVVSEYEGRVGAKEIKSKGIKSVPLKKYFSGAIGKILAEQTTNLGALFERMFKGVTRGGLVEDKSGLTKVKNGKAVAETRANNIAKEYVTKYYKQKANNEKFNSAKNNVERGMIAFVSRNVIGTKAEIEAEFNRRKTLLSESINVLLNGTEKEIKKGEMYKEIYDKLGVEAAKSATEISSKADPVNAEAVVWWTEKWAEIFPELADVSQGIYNKILDKDTDYNPDRYKRTSGASKIEDLSNEESAFHYNTGTIYKKETGVLMSATRPTTLPIGKRGKPDMYVDLSFDNNNASSIYDALVDINTASAIRQVDGFIKSPEFDDIVNAEDRDLFERRIDLYIRKIRNKAPFVDDELEKGIKKLSNIAAVGVGQALGGITQPIKQVFPVVLNTLINAGSFDVGSLSNKDKRDFINRSGYSIANRGVESQAQIDSINRIIEVAADSNTQRVLRGIEKINNFWLKNLLVKSDAWVARVSWITYYEQSLKNQGIDPDGIDWATHQVNEEAGNYAQRMVDRQQNISDPAQAGALFAESDNSFKNFIVKMSMPFASFRLNQSTRLANDLSVLSNWSVSTKEDKAIALRSLGGFSVEVAAFSIISGGLSILIGNITNLIMGDEEEKKDYDKRVENTIKYQAGKITSDILSPVPVLDKAVQFGVFTLADDIQNIVGIPEDEKKNIFEPKTADFIEGLGLLGISAQRVAQIVELGDLSLLDGTFEDKFGNKKQLLEEDKDKISLLIAPAIASSVGVLPSEANTIIRNALRNAKKRASRSKKRRVSGGEGFGGEGFGGEGFGGGGF